MGKLWFKKGVIKRHSGFDKTKSVAENLRVMYKNTHLKNPTNAWRRVGRQANVLANLTQDFETRIRARTVANEAFNKLAKLQE